MNHFNYVFFWRMFDYYQHAFSEIMEMDNVVFRDLPYIYQCSFLRNLHFLHHSSRINGRILLPGRNLWRKSYFKDRFPEKRPVIFVFHGNYYWMRSLNYFSFLRSRHEDCKCVLLLMDTVASYLHYFNGKFYGDFDIDYLKKEFDAVLTYNKLDADKYGFIYYPSIYSGIEPGITNVSSDVFFVGRAKDRLGRIHSLYSQLTELGLKCDFYILDVSEQDQLFPDGIHYNTYLSYKEIIEHVNACNAILEIVQGGSDGFTFRLDEALVFNKIIITNNPVVDTIPYSDSEKIIRIKDKINFDQNRFELCKSADFDYKNDYSPKNLLRFLEDLFAPIKKGDMHK